jgi:hypothetical protein
MDEMRLHLEKNMQSTFTHLSYAHVYREKNTEADKLSKEALKL